MMPILSDSRAACRELVLEGSEIQDNLFFVWAASILNKKSQ